MSDFNWNFPADMKPSGRSLREVCEEAQEDFFKIFSRQMVIILQQKKQSD